MDSFAPIVLFVYNRPVHTSRTIEALKANTVASKSDLIIYADAAKNYSEREQVAQVRDLISNISGFKKISIIEQSENRGLANSIIKGVTEILNKYEMVIILEDDLVTSPLFLEFMNDSLNYYKDEDKVFAVSGYSNITIPKSYENKLYFSHISTSWGWGTWKDRWDIIEWDNAYYLKILKDKKLLESFCKKVGNQRINMLKLQMDGKIDSWAVRRLFTQLLQKKFTLFPITSFVKNIGVDGSGIHCGNDRYFDVNNKLSIVNLFEELPFYENKYINKAIFKKNHIPFVNRIIRKIKKIVRDWYANF